MNQQVKPEDVEQAAELNTRPELSREQAEALLLFLQRTNMTGQEMPAYVDCFKVLNQIIEFDTGKARDDFKKAAVDEYLASIEDAEEEAEEKPSAAAPTDKELEAMHRQTAEAADKAKEGNRKQRRASASQEQKARKK